jgi:hypothetical protein
VPFSKTALFSKNHAFLKNPRPSQKPHLSQKLRFSQKPRPSQTTAPVLNNYAFELRTILKEKFKLRKINKFLNLKLTKYRQFG